MTFLKWYTRITSAVGTIVILLYVGDAIMSGVRTVAEMLQQFAGSF